MSATTPPRPANRLALQRQAFSHIGELVRAALDLKHAEGWADVADYAARVAKLARDIEQAAWALSAKMEE